MNLRNLKLIVIAVISLLVLLIVFRNWEPVETDFLISSMELPRPVLLLGTTLIGFVIGILTAFFLVKGDEGSE